MQYGKYICFVVKNGMNTNFYTGSKRDCEMFKLGVEMAGGVANLQAVVMSTPTPKKVKVQLWRNPTKQEIKFGEGAIHYLEISMDEKPKRIFAKHGGYSRPARVTVDGLIYNVAH